MKRKKISEHFDLPSMAQLRILEVMWPRGPCTLNDILEHINTREPRLTPGYVGVMLARMGKKKLVTRQMPAYHYDELGRLPAYYEARVSRAAILHAINNALLLHKGAPGYLRSVAARIQEGLR